MGNTLPPLAEIANRLGIRSGTNEGWTDQFHWMLWMQHRVDELERRIAELEKK